ncbi:MAG: ABC transporter permease [Acidobacteria bacterium]|nr:ABC transporter permease [Acidobacteriota bacterium]
MRNATGATGAVRAFFQRLRGTLQGSPQLEDDFNAELESHIQMHTDDNIRAGLSPTEARRAAILQLGVGVEAVKEAHRDRRAIPVLSNLGHDIRFTFRQMGKNRGFSVVAIAILALGLAASVSIFAFVDAALIQPLPYQDPARLMGVYETKDTCKQCNLSYLDYVDWKRLNTVFSALEIYNARQFLLRTASGVEQVAAIRISSGFFRVLGVRPALGRDFLSKEDEPSAPLVALLSYESWQNRYGGSGNILGQTINLAGAPTTIIGVLPRGFHFSEGGPAEFWQIHHQDTGCEQRRSCHNLYGVARLKDGVSEAAALANIQALAQQLEKEHPDSNRDQAGLVVPLTEVVSGPLKPILLALLGGASLLMVIVWANVASLLLVRAESRKKELAVRRALGATTGRLVSQFVAEAIVLTSIGAALGLLAAQWSIQLLLSLIPKFMLENLPFLLDLGLHPRVLLFAAAMALVAAVIFALTPAVHLALSKTREGLAEGSRGSAGMAWRRIGSKLVVAELATAVILLVSAGLLGKSLYRLLNVELGFRPEHLLTLQLGAPASAYPTSEKQVALQRRVMETLSQLPGVTSVGVSSQMPVSHNGNTTWLRIVGKPHHGEHNDTPERAAGVGYFETVGARLKRGRYFEEADSAGKPPVAIINETFARTHFAKGEDPIGRQVAYLSQPAPPMTIVGLVEDLREGQLNQVNRPVLYLPFNQSPDRYMVVTVRTSASNAEQELLGTIQKQIRALDSELVTTGAATMRERIQDSPAAYLHRSSTWLVGAFAALALLLCVIGLYGVIAYSVSQRTREIGVRMALGAGQSVVCRMVLGEAGWLTAAGLAIGLGCAVGVARLLDGLLFGVSPWDGLTLGAVAVVLSMAALLASYVPARRAAAVNPIEALRSE